MKNNFSEKLITVRDKLGLKNYELAERLGVSANHISRLIGGEKPSPTLEKLVAQIDKEIFSTQLKETPLPYKAGIVLPPEVLKTVERYAAEARVSPLEFIARCVTDFGRDTRDDILRHTPAPNPSGSGNAAPPVKSEPEADKDLAAIVTKKAQELESRSVPPPK